MTSFFLQKKCRDLNKKLDVLQAKHDETVISKEQLQTDLESHQAAYKQEVESLKSELEGASQRSGQDLET